MSQKHFTLSFSLKSPADAKVLAEQLPPLMPQLFQAADTIGTIHYSRFTVLSEKTLLFLGDFDGEFSQLMADLAAHAGPVFDAIFEHVDNPPTTPVADHSEAFVEWTAAHLVHPLNIYTAYPDVTAKEIKALAVRRRRHRRRRTTPIPGDPAHQVTPCLRRGKTALARKGARDNQRPGQRRHASFRTVRAA
jgi:hypothetical protein